MYIQVTLLVLPMFLLNYVMLVPRQDKTFDKIYTGFIEEFEAS